MKMTKICVPELGEDIEQATVVEWHVKVGDVVCQDDDVVELVTDKATFNVAAPVSGVLTKIIVDAGSDVAIGAAVGEIN